MITGTSASAGVARSRRQTSNPSMPPGIITSSKIRSGGVAFANPDVRIELGSAAELGLADGDWPRVALGVRAEDVTIHPVGSETGRVTFPSTVGLMEPIGSDTFVELLVGDATIVARVDPDTAVAPSQPVSATLRPGGIHLFSRDTGERIVA